MEGELRIKYQPFTSRLDPGFWQKLSQIKLNELKLKNQPVDIQEDVSTCPIFGKVLISNMKQEFIDLDKKKFINSIGSDIWQAILDGQALENPAKHLSRCGLIVFADLKKYKFYYMFAFPALSFPKDVYLGSPPTTLAQIFQEEAMDALEKKFNYTTDSEKRGYFLVTDDDHDNPDIKSLKDYKNVSSAKHVYFAYLDPSADEEHPGWPMRNYICLIAIQFKLDRFKIIRVRQNQHRIRESIVLDVMLKIDLHDTFTDMPAITGWEKNEHQQTAPRVVDLEHLLNPERLAEDAVNLNLKLMKWRLLPELDLDRISAQKCLLLGCGTLGCHIARGLLAWGIKYLTIVDNSKVSYSNPVRQSLFSFEDCKKQTFKAEAAVESLKRIYPSVICQSHILSIPMPGHFVGSNELNQCKSDVELLESLIEQHDVIFLLMDSRESRWLPTVIAMSKQKLVINAAIGFDTFLLQRHGVREYPFTPSADDSPGKMLPSNRSNVKIKIESSKLGCYFCNDIVAPGDSTTDRTLDQQCTVSRPGVSMVVSALAIEMVASLFTSPQGPRTPAYTSVQSNPSQIDDEDCDSELGFVPHSIRGNLSRFHMYMPTSPCFNKCSACSNAVVTSYMQDKFDFLLKVFNDSSYLEEVAGLKELQYENDNVWILDD